MHSRSECRRAGPWSSALSTAALLGASAVLTACDARATGPTSPAAPQLGTATGIVHVVGQPGSAFAFRGDVSATGTGSSWGALRNLTVEHQRALTMDLDRMATASAAADKIVGSAIKTRKYHFKDRDGHLHSLAIVDGADSRHPRAVYHFAGDTIKLVASFAYDLAGRPREVLYTAFGDDGRPTVQVKQAFTARTTAAAQPSAGWGWGRASHEVGARLGQFLADVALPKPLYAEDDDTGCIKQWVNYLFANADFADASTAIEQCAKTGYCGAGLVSLIANLTAATTELTAAINALADCQSKLPSSGSSGGGTSDGGTPSGGGGYTDGSGGTPIDDVIDEFINSSGTQEYCDATGDDCVYVLMQ